MPPAAPRPPASTSRKDAKTADQGKKPYESPVLVEYGSLAAITASMTMSGTDATAMMQSAM